MMSDVSAKEICRWRPDARILIMGVVAWTCVAVIVQDPRALVMAVGLAVLLARMLGAPWSRLLRRLGVLNVFFVFLLPLVAVESFAVSAWPWRLMPEHLRVFAAAVLRANAILAFVQGAVSAITVSELGAALAHWRCPSKLAHLLVFSARYIDVLQAEWRTSVQAARLRGFRMRADLRAWRSLGVLAGGLFLRSLDHAEQLLVAMKCRGYNGRFYALTQLRYALPDFGLGVVLGLSMGLLVWMDRL